MCGALVGKSEGIGDIVHTGCIVVGTAPRGAFGWPQVVPGIAIGAVSSVLGDADHDEVGSVGSSAHLCSTPPRGYSTLHPRLRIGLRIVTSAYSGFNRGLAAPLSDSAAPSSSRSDIAMRAAGLRFRLAPFFAATAFLESYRSTYIVACIVPLMWHQFSSSPFLSQ